MKSADIRRYVTVSRDRASAPSHNPPGGDTGPLNRPSLNALDVLGDADEDEAQAESRMPGISTLRGPKANFKKRTMVQMDLHGKRARETPPEVEPEAKLLPMTQQQSELIQLPGTNDRPTLGLSTAYAQHGRKVAKDIKSGKLSLANKKKFGSKYRMKQMRHKSDMGGTGYDEKVSTATSREILNQAPPDQLFPLASKLSSSREPVTNLLWATSGTDKELAGHPGALTSKPGDMRNGVTHEHTDRDFTRASWVDKQFRQAKASGDPGAVRKTMVMADIMTNQVMSQPMAALTQASNPLPGKVYHAQFGDLSKEHARHHAFAKVHNERERRKISAARELMDMNMRGLVDPAMQDLILKHQGNVQNAVIEQSFEHQDVKDDGPVQSQAILPDKGDPALTLDELALQAPLKRAVSAPRNWIGPRTKG